MAYYSCFTCDIISCVAAAVSRRLNGRKERKVCWLSFSMSFPNMPTGHTIWTLCVGGKVEDT